MYQFVNFNCPSTHKLADHDAMEAEGTFVERVGQPVLRFFVALDGACKMGGVWKLAGCVKCKMGD